ncbi:hypothetical protein PM082_019274 [Marasmius tenuissimus]|nr:hypothetical protein PM082_019274 [Marasmius tenuissimus]
MATTIASAHDVALSLLCNRFHISALSLVVFDHLCTLDVELRCLWKGPLNRSRYLFFTHRYSNLLSIIPALISMFPMGSTVILDHCRLLGLIREASLMVSQLIISVIISLRMYALYARNKRLLYIMASLIIGILGFCIYLAFGGRDDDQTASSVDGVCQIQLTPKLAYREALGWTAVFAYDTFIFVLVVVKALKTRRQLRLLRQRTSILAVLLRDGAKYFGFMLIAHVVNILTFLLADGCMRGGIAPITWGVSVALTSRFMLNLHEAMDGGIYAESLNHATQQNQAIELRRLR